jgi:2-succinyl-5-enolpyruvyl-6-hydroxy-3-cyclohexene-1-carboxylate synthase
VRTGLAEIKLRLNNRHTPKTFKNLKSSRIKVITTNDERSNGKFQM